MSLYFNSKFKNTKPNSETQMDYYEAIKETIKAEVIYWEYGSEFGVGICLIALSNILIRVCKSVN